MPKRKTAPTDEANSPKRQAIEQYRRWHHKGPPITDFKSAPKGWLAEDHDIHEDDVAANIQRCKERIEDRIMPQWWEKKLKKYQNYKASLDKVVKAAPPGLDLDIYLRLRHLQEIRGDLKRAGHKLHLINSIDGITKTYESGKLKWIDGMVTYWSNGKRVCDGPKEFSWKDFDYYSEKYKKRKGFWVEGMNGPGPIPVLPTYAPDRRAFTIRKRTEQFQHMCQFSLRVPEKPIPNSPGRSDDEIDQQEGVDGQEDLDTSIVFSFLDDTGSSIMVMYEDDIESLGNKAHELPKVMGAARLNGAFGGWWVLVYKLEVNMRDHNGNNLTEWTPIQVAVLPWDREVGVVRLSGPWMRLQFFVGSSPSNGLLCVAKNKTLFKQLLEPIYHSAVELKAPPDVALQPNPPRRIYGKWRGRGRPGLVPIPDSDSDLDREFFTPNTHFEGSVQDGASQV